MSRESATLESRSQNCRSLPAEARIFWLRGLTVLEHDARFGVEGTLMKPMRGWRLPWVYGEASDPFCVKRHPELPPLRHEELPPPLGS